MDQSDVKENPAIDQVALNIADMTVSMTTFLTTMKVVCGSPDAGQSELFVTLRGRVLADFAIYWSVITPFTQKSCEVIDNLFDMTKYFENTEDFWDTLPMLIEDIKTSKEVIAVSKDLHGEMLTNITVRQAQAGLTGKILQADTDRYKQQAEQAKAEYDKNKKAGEEERPSAWWYIIPFIGSAVYEYKNGISIQLLQEAESNLKESVKMLSQAEALGRVVTLLTESFMPALESLEKNVNLMITVLQAIQLDLNNMDSAAKRALEKKVKVFVTQCKRNAEHIKRTVVSLLAYFTISQATFKGFKINTQSAKSQDEKWLSTQFSPPVPADVKQLDLAARIKPMITGLKDNIKKLVVTDAMLQALEDGEFKDLPPANQVASLYLMLSSRSETSDVKPDSE